MENISSEDLKLILLSLVSFIEVVLRVIPTTKKQSILFWLGVITDFFVPHNVKEKKEN